jgi:hypothetical protein
MLDPGLIARLAHQLASFRARFADADPADLSRAPAPGTWSALQNLAHVGRHHEIMLERLARVLAEDAPAFPPYRDAEDAGWAEWQELSPAALWPRLLERRQQLLEWAAGLTREQAARTGGHARFGPMDVVLRLADARAARG